MQGFIPFCSHPNAILRLYVPAYGGALSERLMRPAAVAREQARMQQSFETGQTASDSLIAKPVEALGGPR